MSAFCSPIPYAIICISVSTVVMDCIDLFVDSDLYYCYILVLKFAMISDAPDVIIQCMPGTLCTLKL